MDDLVPFATAKIEINRNQPSPAAAASEHMDVFILWHTHEMESGEEDSKLIGVYSTRQLAEAARERSRQLPGFRDLPDAFVIDDYEVDADHWAEGYVTVHPEQNT